MKKSSQALIIAVISILTLSFVWASMIYGVVNICFEYDFSFQKEMLLGVIFQIALSLIRSTFKERD